MHECIVVGAEYVYDEKTLYIYKETYDLIRIDMLKRFAGKEDFSILLNV